jgi:ribosomal-protein-alanine N-acetyltransferase
LRTNSADFTLIPTARLALVGWTVPLIDALIAKDVAEAERLLDAQFPAPFAPPPETGDVLDFFRNAMLGDHSGGLLVPRMILRSADRTVVGSIGAMAPNESGASMIGYSVYPEFEGNGYASEAARALVEFVLRHSEVKSIFATIAAGHSASEIVASRAGLTMTGETEQDAGITLNVWRRSR